ncbi:MAG TPA: carboxypeptidase-like regulatory domain-containing protein, partial [Chitinophagaceae bacterium]|nr:carboxypeptidase-like regulatory domain-containing protein [Chitinophagaceae bacterium]
QSGTYTILLVNSKFETAVITNIAVSAGATFCINTGGAEYRNGNKVIEQLINESMKPMPVLQGAQKKAERPVLQPEDLLPGYKTGAAFITGKIVDAKGKLPVAFATVTIKGTKRATATNADGEFTLSGLKGGSYTLVISGIGYETAEVLKQAGSALSEAIISLKPAIASLSEVVVTGYGRQRKLDVTGAVAVVKEADLFSSDSLSGKAAGVQVSAENGAPGNTIQIILRGISSSTIDNSPLFIVDGIAYDALPANISPDFIESISVLKGAETAIYGARAAGGVIVITTKTKTLRNQFRDYAFWIPQVLTDKNGNAQFTVTYPDNVTGWQTYVLGMDKHRRIGKATTFVRSYKPVMAQLSTPQFLLQGDTAQVMGKAYNYTQSSYNISSTFNINHVAVMHGNTVLQPNASSVHGYIVAAPVADTVTTAYTLQTTTGFKDGEERKIPVFKPGTEETNGCFWVLRADTSFIYKPQLEGPVNIYVQNNALDFFLQEIELLKKYPYYCMEQTSSKLKGLLMEKRINEALHKPFTDDKTIDLLVDKIRKNQLYDGAWPWWPGGSADIYITNYVIQALVGLRQNPLVETSIRNGLLYLQNQLPTLDGDKLLSTLLTMCKAKHQLNYGPWLKKLTFDSLTILQQWQYVIIQQALGMPHTAELDSLLNRGVPGMLGSLHWGDYNYRWYSDANAATILAFEAMQNEKGYDKELNGIMQYFLQQRADGYWPNTVTSASVLYALVPYVLAQNSSFNRPAEIRVAGDTAFTIQRFPFAGKISNKSGALNIYKTGGGLTYFTVYQHWFNKDPLAVTGNFDITTYFEKDGRKISYLNAGTKVTLVANINVLKEAEYVMIEIPIPAGCTYAMHNQDDWAVHKEFLKNKLVLFTNYLPQGINRFTVELEVRYSGTYTLNPASASLMYFPSFFGRGDMKKVLIQ